MKLNKEQDFVTHIGNEQGVRFVQNGVAFDNAGKPLGQLVDGQLKPFKAPEQPAEVLVEETDLEVMDLPTLKEYAQANNVAFAGNIGADNLRAKITKALA